MARERPRCYKAAWAYEWADDTTIEIGREVQVLKAT